MRRSATFLPALPGARVVVRGIALNDLLWLNLKGAIIMMMVMIIYLSAEVAVIRASAGESLGRSRSVKRL